MRVRKSVPNDAASVVVVLRRSIKELCHEDHLGQRDILELWLANKTHKSVAGWIVAPTNFCVTALSALDEVIGFGMLNRSGKILLLYVLPENIGSGVGHKLLEALEYQAKAWGLAELSLGSTVTAKTFYERHGYNGENPCQNRPDGLFCFAMQKKIDI